MKYRKYIIVAFVAALLVPLFSAKADDTIKLDNIKMESIVFEEQPDVFELGFDTENYLPENFNPYQDVVAIATVKFLEDDTVELGFDTAKYLPENFDPYKK